MKMLEEITVCIGTEEKTKVPCKVLMHSITTRTKHPVKFVLMEGESWINIKERKLGAGTGFSLMRWSIPEKLNYEGFAIYLDADQVCLADIAELWNQNVEHIDKPSSVYCTYGPDKWFSNAPNTSVMLIDCERAKKDWWPLARIVEYLKDDCPARKRYVHLMHAQHISPAPTKIDKLWNDLNICSPTTKLLHYTIEPQQPWYKPNHPFCYVWRQELVKALESGFITKAEVQTEIARYKPYSKANRGQGMHKYWSKWIR